MNNLHQQQQQQPSPDMMKLLELLGNSLSQPSLMQPSMRHLSHPPAAYPNQQQLSQQFMHMPPAAHLFNPGFGAMTPSYAFPAFDAFANPIPTMDSSVFDRMLNDALLFDAFSAMQQQQQQHQQLHQQQPVNFHLPPQQMATKAVHTSFKQEQESSHETSADEDSTFSPHIFQETSPPQTVSLRSISSMSPSTSPPPTSPVSKTGADSPGRPRRAPTPSSPVPVNIQLTPFLSTPAAVCKKSGGGGVAISKRAKKQHVCFNCATDTTPMWRRDDLGRRVCNACGVYYRMNGVNRVVKAGTVPIQRRRNRAKGGKLSGKRKKAQQQQQHSYDDDDEEDEEE